MSQGPVFFQEAQSVCCVWLSRSSEKICLWSTWFSCQALQDIACSGCTRLFPASGFDTSSDYSKWLWHILSLNLFSQWAPFMLQYFQCSAYSRANQGSYSRAVLEALLCLKHFYTFLNKSKHAQYVRSKHTHVGKINIITLYGIISCLWTQC